MVKLQELREVDPAIHERVLDEYNAKLGGAAADDDE